MPDVPQNFYYNGTGTLDLVTKKLVEEEKSLQIIVAARGNEYLGWINENRN
ncbi:hypothetical protein XA3_02720 [Xylocopilactobacillus apicola]|uniref:Uncharacterized protein n=1 Tax=Xylocopilactobacillus apicola TaxID=2932184 RepID=A0AAU9CZH5_9LACO|nr:hypothetical protein XA3_02720 [Xylocopilactobacillus apicola]